MLIKTKYDIGDEVYFIHDDKVSRDRITKIYTTNDNGVKTIHYYVDETVLPQKLIFKTTKGLFDYIKREIKKLNQVI